MDIFSGEHLYDESFMAIKFYPRNLKCFIYAGLLYIHTYFSNLDPFLCYIQHKNTYYKMFNTFRSTNDLPDYYFQFAVFCADIITVILFFKIVIHGILLFFNTFNVLVFGQCNKQQNITENKVDVIKPEFISNIKINKHIDQYCNILNEEIPIEFKDMITYEIIQYPVSLPMPNKLEFFMDTKSIYKCLKNRQINPATNTYLDRVILDKHLRKEETKTQVNNYIKRFNTWQNTIIKQYKIYKKRRSLKEKIKEKLNYLQSIFINNIMLIKLE